MFMYFYHKEIRCNRVEFGEMGNTEESKRFKMKKFRLRKTPAIYNFFFSFRNYNRRQFRQSEQNIFGPSIIL